MLNRGDIKTRLSPSYYYALKNAQIHSNYPKKRLSSLVDMFSGGTPSKNKLDYWQGNIGWISPKDIKEFYIHSAEDFISQAAIDDSATKLASKGSLVMVVRSGILIHTLPVSVLSDDFAINQDIKAIAVRNLSVLPEYLAIFLTIFQERLLPVIVKHSTTVQSVNSFELLHVEVVCPPLNIQHQIIELFQNALTNKRQQETQAQALLDSIDGYLLGELGVTLPPEPDNTIENRMFKTSWRQVSGGRYDPTFHQGNVYGPIANTPYELVPLRKLIQYFQTGFAAGRGDQDLEGNGIIQIRPTNMSSSRELIFDKNVRISPEEGQDYSRDLLVSGEVLFNNTNSQELVGKTVYFDLKGEYFCSNHLTRIKTNERLDGEYLTHLFNLYQRQKVFFKSCINWNNQSGINTDILRGVKIPLPDIHTQKTIAEHINDIRQQAQALRQQAQREFAQAKQEIERLILG